MFQGILPKEFAFFDYFEKHIDLTIKAAHELQKLSLDNSYLSTGAQNISSIEHQADEITHLCTEALHKTFITPFERSDIHHLIKNLDDITDYIDGAASRMVLYELTNIRPEIASLANVLVQSAELIQKALFGLRNMKNEQFIKDQCIGIHKLENEGDMISRTAITRLFKEEEAISVIKWREIFNRLEKAIDRCEALANVIEGVVIASA